MPESAKLPGAEKHIVSLSLEAGGNLRQGAEPRRRARSFVDCTRLLRDRQRPPTQQADKARPNDADSIAFACFNGVRLVLRRRQLRLETHRLREPVRPVRVGGFPVQLV